MTFIQSSSPSQSDICNSTTVFSKPQNDTSKQLSLRVNDLVTAMEDLTKPFKTIDEGKPPWEVSYSSRGEDRSWQDPIKGSLCFNHLSDLEDEPPSEDNVTHDNDVEKLRIFLEGAFFSNNRVDFSKDNRSKNTSPTLGAPENPLTVYLKTTKNISFSPVNSNLASLKRTREETTGE